MPELMKKPRTDKIIELRFYGPEKNREKAVTALKELGFTITSDAVPWREAFPDHDRRKEPGICLAGIRYREGLTQKELAEKSGILRHHISEMENGKRPIGKENAKILGKALNVGYKIFL